MATLIFLAIIITLLIFFIRLIIKIFRHKPVASTIRVIIIVIMSYSLLWCVFYFLSTDKPIAPGTNVCFDDWCATITKIERPVTLGNGDHTLNPYGQFILLHIKMSNNAKGIAQKPSEPRVHLIDEKKNSYSFSPEAQQELEKLNGKQIPIGARLELHQSLETLLVFDVPKDAKNLKVLIEEGPFITKVLFKEDRPVFLVQ